ncbi:MAG: hypothetical protein JWO86_7018 [Myxococcaceae bacterium]|nr:hypothetical protein [Myxococcaceae bacterium]
MRVSFASGSRVRSTSLVIALAAGALAPLAILATASPAYAQDASSQDIAQARQLGQQAQAAYDKGDFAESEKLWAAAAKLYTQAPTLTLGLARTQAKLGKVVAAQESYNKIIREWGNNPNPPPAFKDAVEAAKAEVGAVSAKVASVTVTVEGPASPQVTIDGQAVPAAALGLKRPVDPGSHKVTATADGYKPADTTFSVAEGGSAAATLKMEKAAGVAVVAGGEPPPGAGAGPASPTEPGADTGGSKGNMNKTLAIVAFGVGGAGLVVGAVTGLIASGKASDLKNVCDPDKNCPPSAQSDVDSYKSVATISTIGFVVAGVGGVTGLVLLLTAPKQSAASAASSRYATVPVKRDGALSMTPYFGGTSAGVSGSF